MNSSSVIDSDSILSDSEFSVILEKSININIRDARIHVVLSRKSVVFFTPPICWVSPPKEEDSPPPLGF